MKHPWVTRWRSDDQQGLLFHRWRSSCCRDPPTDHWGLPGDLSYHLTALYHHVGPSSFLSAFLDQLWLSAVCAGLRKQAACSQFTYAHPLLPTPKITYVGIDLNLLWKGFYQPGRLLLLNQTKSRNESDWALHPARGRRQACPGRAGRQAVRSHRDILPRCCSQRSNPATEAGRWPHSIVWTERRWNSETKGKWQKSPLRIIKRIL